MKVYKPVSDREIARRLNVTTINSAYYYLPIIQEIFDLGLVICERVDRPLGEWIDRGEYAECSICGAHSGTQFDGVEPIPLKTKFCPNCGSQMKGEDDDN